MASGVRLGRCILHRWSPELGDPTVLGWVTFGAYGLAGLLCLAAFTRAAQPAIRRLGWCTGLLLLALMANKQLDLQSGVIAVGHCVSTAQGWYEHRQSFQAVFILALMAGFAAFGLWLLWSLRRHLHRLGLALAGLGLLMGFVALRAAGFQHVSAILPAELAHFRAFWTLELGGIALIALNALVALRWQR